MAFRRADISWKHQRLPRTARASGRRRLSRRSSSRAARSASRSFGSRLQRGGSRRRPAPQPPRAAGLGLPTCPKRPNGTPPRPDPVSRGFRLGPHPAALSTPLPTTGCDVRTVRLKQARRSHERGHRGVSCVRRAEPWKFDVPLRLGDEAAVRLHVANARMGTGTSGSRFSMRAPSRCFGERYRPPRYEGYASGGSGPSDRHQLKTRP